MSRSFLSILLIFLSLLPFLYSCNSDASKEQSSNWSELPEVTELKNLKRTDFAAVLEMPINDKKNIIYAPAFSYAWDKVKQELKFPVVSDSSNSQAFRLLNFSNSHENSLTESEYSATATVTNGEIIAKALFNKTLPFETKLEVFDEGMLFDSATVSVFGMKYYNVDLVAFTKILYYKDDGNFILKFVPKDTAHEIILAKGINKYKDLKEGISRVNELIRFGESEKKNPLMSWKYEIVEKDIFLVPVIKFNIETQYEHLVNQKFKTSDNKQHWVSEAYQRTGFILNENGAVVESCVTTSTDSVGVEVKKPKKMVFDKPFLVIIKRKDKSNPYFVMHVANSELLTKITPK